MTTPHGIQIESVSLQGGNEMPMVGFGTWRMGEDASEAHNEIEALQHAYDRGFRHFDTAEMYGSGGSERVLGEALAEVPRGELFVTSKFYPYNAGRADMASACAASLDRLAMDYLDLYLLHWPGSTPIQETLAGAEDLLSQGLIRSFGISNFDAASIAEMRAAGLTDRIAVNQVLYNPARRGIEFDLLPLMQEIGMICVAYTPIEPHRIGANAAFADVARQAGLSPAQLALAWQVTRGVTCPIPKSATKANIDALADAVGTPLSPETLAAIDEACPPPTQPQPLETL
ncbi:MAG: aldo/keto reductase [Pseudomonadota bacterium]